MPGLSKHVKELTGVDPQALPDALLGATAPLLLRGLRAWPFPLGPKTMFRPT